MVSSDGRISDIGRPCPAQTDVRSVGSRAQASGRACPAHLSRCIHHLRPGTLHAELIHRPHPVVHVAAPAPTVRVVEHLVGVRELLPLVRIPFRPLHLVAGHRMAVQILHRGPAQERDLRAVNCHLRGGRRARRARARSGARLYGRRVVVGDVVVVFGGVLGVTRLHAPRAGQVVSGAKSLSLVRTQ